MASCVLRLRTVGACSFLLLLAKSSSFGQPPFFGTAFVDPDIIVASDYSTFESLSYVGIEERFVFDRRDDDFSTKEMHIFDATFVDDLSIEVQVNSLDFADSGEAGTLATTYADSVGRLPTSLRTDVETMWIHDGFEPFGGGNNNILIHVDQAVDYGVYLEEVLVHEATHTSFDADHAAAAGWLSAQDADETFISEYAEDFPNGEDVSETLLMWLAVRYRSPRIDTATRTTIETAIPNRLAYLDALSFASFPQPLFGDYNGDNAVDAADYVMWRDNLGSDYYLNNSGNESDDSAGVVDTADYDLWRSRFGQTPGSGAAFAAPATVPEPFVVVTLLAAALAVSGRRRALCTSIARRTKASRESYDNPLLALRALIHFLPG
jgi:hypothetical protein